MMSKKSIKLFIERFNRKIKGAIIRINSSKLKRMCFQPTDIYPVWQIDSIDSIRSSFCIKSKYYDIFGTSINIENINWHLDYASGFCFLLKPFYSIGIKKFFDNNIDLKFPWEVSRMYFLVSIAINYLKTRDNQLLSLYKSLISSWDENNPYLSGINWYNSMEVGIRAVNILVSYSIISDHLKRDTKFYRDLSILLIKHLEYIEHNFEDINNNHKISSYACMLFLSIGLREHVNSEKYLARAKAGLIDCMEQQVFNDGADYEGSIAYHRLVLELFAYSAIVCMNNNINLPEKFFARLFKMFEYTNAYIDNGGNAPQIGDNDSGRFLIFHESEELDHSYLLKLGEAIFDHSFNRKDFSHIDRYIPDGLARIKPSSLPANTEESIVFSDAQAYILKSQTFSIFIPCFPITNIPTSHYHLDCGSICLSYKNRQIIVDPGSYCYTRNKTKRDYFRSRGLHNVPLTREEFKFNEADYWNINVPYRAKVDLFDKNEIKLNITNLKLGHTINRYIRIENNEVYIIDSSDKQICSLLHFHPDIFLKLNANIADLFLDHVRICKIRSSSQLEIKDYYYSPKYGLKEKALLLGTDYKNKTEYILDFT